jgi:nucleoside-diphosphate-sugar epimerase
MDILITGTTGFVGKNLSSALKAEGHKLIEVNRRDMPGTYSFEALFGGALNAEIWIHLAAQAEDTTNKELLEKYLSANVELSKKVFAAFLSDPSASTFIHFSSVKAAAASVEGPLREEDELEVDIPYGISKRLAEKALLAETLPAGKRLIILRPAMIYGYNTDSNLYSLYKFVKRGIPYPFAAFDNTRTMISVDNLVFVILNIIKNPSFRGGIYNVADDDGISTNEIIALIRKSTGRAPVSLTISKAFIGFLFKCGDLLHLPVNTKKLNKLTRNYVVSNAKLKSELGASLPVSARDGLTRLFSSFYQNNV